MRNPERRFIGRSKPNGSFGLLSVLSVVAVAVVVLAGCSREEVVLFPSTVPVATTTTTPTTATPATTLPAPATTTTTLAPLQTPEEGWGAFWDAWVIVRASDDLDPGPLAGVASLDVAARAVTLFERQRRSGSGPVETEVVLHPKVTDTGPGRVTIEDCVLLAPSFVEAAGVWYRADLVRSTEGPWMVETLRVISVAGCVPQEMADAAIAAYHAYFQARASFWDPPDPDSPLLATVLAEPQKSFIVGLLVEHRIRGVALRGQPTLHPEVNHVFGPTKVGIISCNPMGPDSGVFDIATGERQPDEPLRREGQRRVDVVDMVLEDGVWKISDLQGQADSACKLAPTDLGLPSI